MRKQQKKMLVLAIIAAFMATTLLLPGLTDAGHGFKVPIDKIPWMKAFVEKTGQTTSYATGDDGDLIEGFEWPNPRFTDNGDGTVSDNLTGLIWLKDANCFGEKNWNDALSECNGLQDGDCELTDGSSAGDWRFPNIKELQSLIDYGFYLPALSDTAGTSKWSDDDPFTDVRSYAYWSSTTRASFSEDAWYLWMVNGIIYDNPKAESYYVWPVRGGN
jgi:hypothetical protein